MSSRGRSAVERAVVCAAFCVIALSQDSGPAALVSRIQSLHDAYAKRDADAVLALWSKKSPQLAEERDQVKKLFGAVAEVREETVREPVLSGDRARLRINRELIPKTAGANSTKRFLVVEWVKEQEEWNVWKEGPAARDLAEQLMAAGGEPERLALLSQNSDLPISDVAFAVLDMGHDARIHGDLQRAMAAFQLGLSVAGEGAGSARARALNDIGLVHYDKGELQDSMEWFQKSLAVAEAIHDDSAAARAINNTGNVYKDEGEIALANECYQKDLVLGGKLHDDMVIFNAVGNLGILNTERGNYGLALSYTGRAADLAERFRNKRASALVWINMGQIFERQGDYAQAVAYTQRALDAATVADDRQKMGVAWLNLGTENQFIGDLTSAFTDYEKSLAIFEALGDELHASFALTEMGTVHVARKEFAEGIEYFQKALRIEEGLNVADYTATTLIDMASAYNSKGNFEEALRVATRARELADTGLLIQSVWRAHLQEGSAYRGLGQMDRAKAEYAQAISVIEDIRLHAAGSESEQAGFFVDRLEPYHRMMELLVTEKLNAEAFEYAERGKARTLVDILKSGRPQLDAVLTAEERQRDRELRTKLASLNINLARQPATGGSNRSTQSSLKSDLQNARLEYAAFQTRLYATHPEIRTQRGEMEPVRATEAQELISPDSAFVEFAVTEDRLYLFVSSGTVASQAAPKLEVFVEPIEEQKLSELVKQFRKQLADRDLRFRTTASRLYQLVIGPASGPLSGKKKLVVIPDGVLWDLPFQALLSPRGRYLLEDYSIAYAPSLTALQAMTRVKQQRRREPGKATLLAMGNPAGAVSSGSASGTLSWTESEVRELGKIYGSEHSHLYLGREATEGRFKAEAGEADVLHLATHGVLDDASPLYSYVMLAGDGQGGSEDGLLEAVELLQMPLRAELVVLSACETARGRIGAGEGMIGLSWALFVSGVPSTVLSQWRVDSESTTRLMTAFHRTRQAGVSDAQALRIAALSVRKDPAYEHPFYWAPFIMLGAGL